MTYIGDFAKEQGWESWRDILAFVEELGCKALAKRMNINNACWNSCGEFGRCQRYICDSLLICRTREEAEAMAWDLEEMMAEDMVVELV